MPPPSPVEKIDFRLYLGIVFFRWQIIVVCFLYAMLGGVLYIQLAPKLYHSYARINVYHDPNLQLPSTDTTWTSLNVHRTMLTNPRLRQEVANALMEEWGGRVGNPANMLLPVDVSQGSGTLEPVINVIIRSRFPAYAVAFLNLLVKKHQEEWNAAQRRAREEATRGLREELAKLEERITETENEQIEYQRLHDLARISARGGIEAGYLNALIGQRHVLATELMMLESEHPELKGENIGVISAVGRMNEEIGRRKPVNDAGEEIPGSRSKPLPSAEGGKTDGKEGVADRKTDSEETMGWPQLRVEMARLRAEEKQLLENLTADHPRVVAIRKRLKDMETQLELAAQIQLEQMRDRYRALTIQLKAVEAAEFRWQARDSLNRLRQAEFRRISSRVSRYEQNYNTLYERLHDIMVSEQLKSERFSVAEWGRTAPDPVWPDPVRILLVTVVAGLGSGIGLALVVQILDNKVQSISDVEHALGVPFLGGVPYWVHSGLEKVIRPIVTEEHSSGAIEAYRALRTNVLTAMAKSNEKILLVTSADSREGKTLTALNLAIMITQMNKKVLLVDLDLRRGRLHRSLGLPRDPGLTDALLEDRSLREVIVATRIENLYLMSTGRSVESAAELLEAADLVAKFMEVQDDYDYIIADTSPILRVTDTVIVARQGLGSLLYVVRVNHTPKPLVRYSLDMLRDVRVLGLVMNSIEMHRISSLYYSYQYPNYAYYSNAYAYGYDHYYTDRSGGGPSRRRRRSLRSRFAWGLENLRRRFLPTE